MIRLPVRRRRALALAAATSMLAVVAGCGSDDDGKSSSSTAAAPPTTTTTAKPAGNTFTVTEREYSLTPADPELPSAGEFTIQVRNAGGTEHALEVEGPDGEVDTDPIQPGGTAQLKVKLTKPGRYEWYCPIDDHKGKGMRGTIVVAGGKSKSGDKGKDSDDHGGKGGSGSGDDDSGGAGSGSNDDSTGDESMESEGDSGGIGPSNDSNDGYGPG
ncbi:MAG TPA: cupredoxin domain-containing protein [Thermoleophilaceae bacterium]|nr:cupredoxin domain-containing protein [Thermoleophilaceae bacterium]